MNLDPVDSSIPMNLDPDEVVGPFLKNKKYGFEQNVRERSVRGTYFIIRRYNQKKTGNGYPNVELYSVDIDYMPGPNQQLQTLKNVSIIYNINERAGRIHFNNSMYRIKNMPPEENINRRNRRSSKLRKISRRSKSYRRRKTNRRN